ncbi:hypothetical protein JW921_03760 [Candidatus Fermentibacterales bacterium]|nr:hypothetical protein [Candidatus Fermentibacterales bacterium]
MSEREARKKWCPFSMCALREASTTGSGSSTQVTVNRGHDLDNLCVGSACMAWRWVGEGKRVGYCGLASGLAAPGAALAAGEPSEADSLLAEMESASGALMGDDATEEIDIPSELRICGLCARMIVRENVKEGYDGYCPIFDVDTKANFQCDPSDDHWVPAEGVCGSCRHMRLGTMRDGYDGFCEKIGGYVRYTDKCPTGFWQKGQPSSGS